MNWGREEIIDQSLEILDDFTGMKVTIRQLHYQLVGRGMPNTMKHYKRVIGAMEKARWDGRVEFDAFVDHERDVIGQTAWEPTDLESSIEEAKRQIRAWMKGYGRRRWENQPKYVEVWIEKKTLQNVAQSPCLDADVGLFPCKGYPSLTAIHEASVRFQTVESDEGRDIVILYAGDHDPSGDDIPRSIVDNLARMGTHVDLKRIALTYDQVTEYDLPPAPTKRTDSRSAGWDGHGQVELDAIHPKELQRLISDAIKAEFDEGIYEEIKEVEEEELVLYQSSLRKYVEGLS